MEKDQGIAGEPYTMTVPQLSQKLQIGIVNTYKLVKTTGFPSVRFGRKILVPVREFEAWLKNRTTIQE